MRVFKSDPFPPIEIDADAGYWSGDIQLCDQTLSLSMYIDSAVSDAQLKEAADRLENLADLRTHGRDAIRQAAARDETIRTDFFLLHLEMVPESLPEAVRNEPTDSAFVDALELCGVGIHADEGAFEIWLDFGFGKQHSDQLLSIKFGPDGRVRRVNHES